MRCQLKSLNRIVDHDRLFLVPFHFGCTHIVFCRTVLDLLVSYFMSSGFVVGGQCWIGNLVVCFFLRETISMPNKLRVETHKGFGGNIIIWMLSWWLRLSTIPFLNAVALRVASRINKILSLLVYFLCPYDWLSLLVEFGSRK